MVGERVELVGQITSVKEGVGKRGRGRGLPYVFINFGPWNQKSVKITLWSEGLGHVRTRPTEAWAGRWVSVTGLIEPPYHGSFRGRDYVNVGVTVTSDGQIVQLTEKEAKFRLGAKGGGQSSSRSNKDVLGDLKGRRPESANARFGVSGGGKATTSSPPSPPASANQAILAELQARSSPASQGRPAASPSPLPKPSADTPWWIWAIAAVAVIYALSRCS